MSTKKSISSFFILGACFLWASDMLVRYPVTLKMESHHLLFWENLFGLLFFLPFALKNRVRELCEVGKKDFLLILFLGLFGSVIGGYFFNISISKVTPGTFSLLQIVQPLFVVYIARFFLKEVLDRNFLVWGSWIIFSAFLIQSHEIELGLMVKDFTSQPLAIFMGIGAMLIWGVCTVIGKNLLERHSAFKVFLWRWLLATIFSGFAFLLSDSQFDFSILMNLDFILRVSYIGIIAGCFAMWLYYLGLKNLKASVVAFIELSYPAFGMVFSSIYIHGQITIVQLLGFLSLALAFYFYINANASREKSSSEMI